MFSPFLSKRLLYWPFGCILRGNIIYFADYKQEQSKKVSIAGESMTARVKVLTKEGLHARPASQIAAMLSKRDARLKLVKHGAEGGEADCSSVLELLILAAGFDTELELFAEGPEAAEALKEVSGFFERKFDEEEF